MFADKYKPKSARDIVGQEECVRQIGAWLGAWKPGAKALFLYGPSGTGKTSLVEAIAAEKKLELIELNASDYRTAEQIEGVIGQASKQQSLFNRGKIMLIDEVDGITGDDRGAVASIAKIIKESRFPVVLTANDAWDIRLRNLHAVAELVKFKKVAWTSISKRLGEIALNEKIKIAPEILKEISIKSSGDMRSAINDLETVSMKKTDGADYGMRDRAQTIFESIRTVFKTETAITARRALDGVDEEPETVFWWIENNIANEYREATEIAKAFEKLSLANLMFARIKSRQRWSLLSYAIEMMTAGVAMSKKNRYASFTQYRPPEFLMMMGRTKKSRAMRNEICAKIGKRLHASSKTVRTEYLPYLKIIMKNDPEAAKQLGLGEDEIKFLND